MVQMRETTIHPDEGALQAFADGELPAEERLAVETHLADCAACRAELDGLRAAAARLRAALRLLDPPAARPLARPPSMARPRRPGWAHAALPRAAVFLVAFAAVASATIPGSPVRAWIESLGGGAPAQVALQQGDPEPEAVALAAAAPETVEAGVSVLPVDGRVRVLLENPSPELQVRAVVTESRSAGVYASGDAASARFRTGPGRIEVADAGAGELRIELPRSALRATVEVNGRAYLVKEGDQLRLSVPAQERSETEVTFRVQR
jgi:anti-sigma factor RsiW